MDKNNIDINEEQLEKEAQNETVGTGCESPENGGDTQDTVEEKAEGEDSEDSKEEAPKEDDELQKAQAQVEELQKQLLYKAAEFENFRKRTIAEKTELILNGGQNVIKAILPVLDDMERAMQNASKTEDIKALEEGWELIAKKLEKTLEGLGVKRIDTTDADFDTDFHEAVAMVPGMGDDKKGKVIDCMQTGYTMNDKVLRHAKVAVGQ